MVQLYHVALTAGKAHKDHKHHHVHHFKHDGTPVDSSTEPATEPPAPQATPLGNGNFLIGGQLQRPSSLNIVPAPQQMIPIQLPNGLQFQQEYVNGQLGSRIISEQLFNSVQPDHIGGPVSIPQISITPSAGQPTYSSRPIGKTSTVLLSGSLFNPANVQYVDDMHSVYKRNSKRDKRDNPEKELSEQLKPGDATNTLAVSHYVRSEFDPYP